MTANGIPNNDEDATVMMEAADTKSRGQTAEPSRRRKRNRKPIGTIWGIGFLLAMIAIGGVAWKVLPHSSNADDGDEIADIDGFDADTPSLGTPVPDDMVASNTQNSATIELPPLTGEIAIPSRNATASSVAIGTRTTANAWLTGTIEDADSTDGIRVPERLSGGRSDNSSFR
ncbi:hypothetical protein [Schlesneria paludicola]|uniref:hypothetical protein n=1 Tax=Schlesneria paludicola TaxID=360056 RepID=UPI00029AC839|nr:hypothetical protein [Schlesneria paludicola]